MKSFSPIAILLCSCVLVACEGGVSVGGNEPFVPTLFAQTETSTTNDPKDWFDEAEVLAIPGQDELTYLEQLGAFLTHYVEITNEPYPSGINVEITNALLGQNSKNVAILDADHPRINDNGEIIDSWGTPYYFHSDTSQDISIQSAGPDLLHYTEDDIVYEALNTLVEIAEEDTFETSEDGDLQLGAALPSTGNTTRQAQKSTFLEYENGSVLAE